MKYLKLFATLAEYNTAKTELEALSSYVSFVQEDSSLTYYKKPTP